MVYFLMRFLGIDYRRNWRTITSGCMSEGKIEERDGILEYRGNAITAFKRSGKVGEKVQRGTHQGRLGCGAKPGRLQRTEWICGQC